MKTILSSMILMLSLSAFGAGWHCEVSDPHAPYQDEFLIHPYGADRALIFQRRKLMDGSFSSPNEVPGCHNARSSSNYEFSDFRVTCGPNGEEGIFDLYKGTGQGFIFFYVSKLGYAAGTSIELECAKVP